jgi:hypothetical protein
MIRRLTSNIEKQRYGNRSDWQDAEKRNEETQIDLQQK